MGKKIDDSFFVYNSIAIAGVSTEYNTGKAYLDLLLESGFQGKIYPLNPKGGEISGLTVYPSIGDVPGPVDYVISCIPKGMAIPLIRDCAAKGVKVIAFFTAGFSESGREEDGQLESEMRRAAQDYGLRVLGPNCMGLYIPKLGMSIASDLPKESGNVAFVSQSGGNTVYLIRRAAQRGVRFSKAISYGNAADVGETDLLEYLKTDNETQVVAAYIEGIKDGTRFCRVLREISAVKPVIVLKAGNTLEGAIAAASHTGSLAGSPEVWEGLLHQAGAVQVGDLDELIDMMVACSFMAVPRGRRVAVVGGGGGFAVLAADKYVGSGFAMPPLGQQAQEELEQEVRNYVATDAGTILKNPYDVGNLGLGEGVYTVLRKLAISDSFDLLAGQVSISNAGWPSADAPASTWPDVFIDAVTRVRAETNIPVAAIIDGILLPTDQQRSLDLERRCYEAGVPVFGSAASAAKSIARLLDHHGGRI